MSTQEANNVNREGTLVEVSGEVTDFAPNIGGGTNIRIDDGSGECLIRVWNTTGVNLSGVGLGEQLRVQGPLDIYQGITQLLLAYQEDFDILQALPGDGTGLATVSPDSVGVSQSSLQLNFEITGQAGYTLQVIYLGIPSEWQWSGSLTDVTLEGIGFTGSQLSLAGEAIVVNQANISSASMGRMVISGLTSPGSDTYSTFIIKTATAGGVLKTISENPRVKVGQGISAVSIREIQQNTPTYLGQSVTILGVVVLGAGITTTGWTDAYVQDNSGYGINIYQGGSVDNRLIRGNLVAITGTVDEYNGTTEIVDYSLQILGQNNSLPAPLILSTTEIIDIQWEGVFIQATGIINDIYSAGGGITISLDDGSGPGDLRIWDTAGLNVGSYTLGDTITARGPLDIYQGSGQMLIGYQDDIFKPGAGGATGDGSGFATLNRDSIPVGQSNISLILSLWSSPGDTLRTLQIWIPAYWGWTGLKESVQLLGGGLIGASHQVLSEYGEYYVQISGCSVTENDSGYITVSQLSVPVESTFSLLWIKTAVSGGVPRFIQSSPQLVVGSDPCHTIRDLQFNSTQFKTSVKIRGAVTVGSGVLRTDRTSAYIQDDSQYGINVSQSGAPDPRYRRGFFVELEGTVSEYRETTQITPQQVAILDSITELPVPFPVNTRDANSPRWDGTLIRVPRNIGSEYAVVTDKYTTSTQAPFDFNVVVNDGSGALTLRVWATTGINLDSVIVNRAIVTSGVGSVFIQNNLPLYQILPAYQEDIIPDVSYEPSLDNVFLDIPPHPFVPDRGEKIQIRYNAGSVNNRITIRLFDLSGRLVTTLLEETAQLIANTLEWDGRDRVLDFVPLGTYLCQLEIMEPVTGKKRTEVAPIVVGTILKK